MSSARKNILKRIEKALEESVDIPFPDLQQTKFTFQNSEKDLQALFTKEFTALDGQLIFCSGETELMENIEQLAREKNWKNIQCNTSYLLKDMNLESLSYINSNGDHEAEAGLSDCECLVARTGTVVLSSSLASGRVLPIYSPIHLIITSLDHLVFDIGNAIELIQTKYADQLPSAIFFASGPSRTADIEKRLVLGVHGPKEVYLFLMGSKLKQPQNQDPK